MMFRKHTISSTHKCSAELVLILPKELKTVDIDLRHRILRVCTNIPVYNFTGVDV